MCRGHSLTGWEKSSNMTWVFCRSPPSTSTNTVAVYTSHERCHNSQYSITSLSVFSFLRRLTTWHCPHLPAARCCCWALARSTAIDRYLLPAATHGSKSAAAGLLLWAHAWTDGQRNERTSYRYIHCRSCSAYYDGSANNNDKMAQNNPATGHITAEGKFVWENIMWHRKALQSAAAVMISLLRTVQQKGPEPPAQNANSRENMDPPILYVVP